MSQKINLNAYTKSLSCENISPATYLNEDVYTIEAFKIPESEWSKAQTQMKKIFDELYTAFIKIREQTILNAVKLAKTRANANLSKSELTRQLENVIELVDKQKAWKEFIAIVTGESKEKGAHIMTINFKEFTKILALSLFQKILQWVAAYFNYYIVYVNVDDLVIDLKIAMEQEGRKSPNQYQVPKGKKESFFKIKWRNGLKQFIHSVFNHHWNTNAELVVVPLFKIKKSK